VSAPVASLTLDVTRLVGRVLRGRVPTGVDRVGLAYVEHYRTTAGVLLRTGFLWWEAGPRVAALLWDGLLSGRRRIVLCGLCRVLVASLVAPRSTLPICNAVHSGTEDPRYAQRLRRLGRRGIYVLHDLIPVNYPEYARPGEAARHKRRLETLVASGALIVANSQETATQFRAYARGRSAVPVTVAPLGLPALPGQSAVPIATPYFVVLGTIEPRKNHALLLQVWRRLVERLGTATPTLVLIGRRGWECEHVVDLLERCADIRPYVREIADASDATLVNWLKSARALLFPTFAEGYGLPVIEALALGVPVVASDLTVFRESVGDIPEYLDPLDGPAWCQAVLDYLPEEHPRRTAQAARQRGFIAPTWASHFAAVDAALAAVTAMPTAEPSPAPESPYAWEP